jgi:predicted ATPase
MVLNEPETSLHPDLLPPLGRLIAQASQHSQIIVVSHATPLVAALEKAADVKRIVLEKQLGETIAADDETPSWTWPSR